MIRQVRMQVFTLLVTLFAQAIALSARKQQALPPSKDPWYTAPDGYEDATPGVVLRIRTASGNFTAVYGAAEAYNLLFRTTNKEAVMGYHGIPQIPLYIYKAIHDEITPIMDTDRLDDFYCTAGANILYERNTAGGHVSEEINGDANAFDFLNAIFNQTYQHSGCTIRNVTGGGDGDRGMTCDLSETCGFADDG